MSLTFKEEWLTALSPAHRQHRGEGAFPTLLSIERDLPLLV